MQCLGIRSHCAVCHALQNCVSRSAVFLSPLRANLDDGANRSQCCDIKLRIGQPQTANKLADDDCRPAVVHRVRARIPMAGAHVAYSVKAKRSQLPRVSRCVGCSIHKCSGAENALDYRVLPCLLTESEHRCRSDGQPSSCALAGRVVNGVRSGCGHRAGPNAGWRRFAARDIEIKRRGPPRSRRTRLLRPGGGDRV